MAAFMLVYIKFGHVIQNILDTRFVDDFTFFYVMFPTNK